MTRKNQTQGNPRVEAYFSKAPEFARPICEQLRAIVLSADPEIVEDWKWGPHYSKNGMVCGIGAFKKHVGLWFFKGALMKDSQKLFLREAVDAKSMRKINFTNVNQIEKRILTSYIREAVLLNSMGVKIAKKQIVIPNDFQSLLTANKKVKTYFDSLAYTHKKEYVRWIEEAKKEETRQRRLKKAMEMIREKMNEQ